MERNGERIPVGSLPLIVLLQRVVECADRDALEEFLANRPVFRARGKSMRLIEFVEYLVGSSLIRNSCGSDLNSLEQAADLTLDRFCRLPARSGEVDCRRYLQAFLDYATQSIPRDSHPLAAEADAARLLQQLVIRHFRFCCREALRGKPRWRRIEWASPGGQRMWLRIPRSLSTRECRHWLTLQGQSYQGVPTQVELQRRIDTEFDAPRSVGLSGEIADRLVAPLSCPSIDEDMAVRGMAIVVAEEKAANIRLLRPAIRALGPVKLQRLIEHVFEDLAAGAYSESSLAKRFGLSNATFSRFAGSNWRRGRAIPDLWRNLAHLLSRHPTFREAAKAAGVWPEVERVRSTAEEHHVVT